MKNKACIYGIFSGMYTSVRYARKPPAFLPACFNTRYSPATSATCKKSYPEAGFQPEVNKPDNCKKFKEKQSYHTVGILWIAG